MQYNRKHKRDDLSRPSDVLSVINDIESFHTSGTEIDDTIDVKIPGFDDEVDILRELEINSLTFNKIAVKHRLTNVIVQFDLTVPTKPRDILDEKNSSFVPLSVTKSNTKVFKCNTKIVNAILPAELCSLIPNLMRDFIDSKAHLTLFPLPLPAIELQECACATSDIDLYSICKVDPYSVLGLYDIPHTISHYILSPVLKTVLDWGTFAVRIITSCASCAVGNYVIKYTPSTADVSLLPALPSPIPIFQCIVSPLDFLMPKANSEEEWQSSDALPSNCRALQVREPYVYTLDGMAKTRLMETKRKFYSFNLAFYLPPCLNPLTMKCDMLLTEIERLKGCISITANNMHLESISSRFLNMKVNGVKKNVPQIGFTSVAFDKVITEVLPIKARQSKVALSLCGTNLICEKPDIVSDLHTKTGKKDQKFRKHRYVKFYKKCKSTTNISGERYCTPLNKITNLDEFFQALGSAKTLSSVFDEPCGKKIMAAIDQVKMPN